MIKQVFYFILFTLITGLMFLCIQKYFNSNFWLTNFWFVFALLFVIVFLSFSGSLFVILKTKTNATFILLAIQVFKFFLCLLFAVIYIQFIKVKAVVFVSNFFSIYLLFSIFEIYSLLFNLRHQNKKLKTSN